jgi:hypothetical protein
MSAYLKALMAVIVSLVGAVGLALTGIGSDAEIGDIDGKNWLVALISVLGSGGMVWLVQNIPGVAGGVIKAVVALLTAGFASLVIALDPDENGVVRITQSEWLVAIGAAVVATGFVYQATNTDEGGTV